MNASAVLRCEDALRLLAEFLDHELADDDRAAVERHLGTCRSCYSRAEFERRLRAQLNELSASDIPDSLDRRIRSLIGDMR
jgi:anti-sigma factor (TIGR02949 family)